MRRKLITLALVFLAVMFPALSLVGEEVVLTPHRILRVATSNGVGHACPIGPRLAISNAHVFAERSLMGTEYTGGRYEPLAGVGGFADVAGVMTKYADIVILRLSRDVQYYQIAKEGPKVGEKLSWLSYNWEKRRDAGKPLLVQGEVTSVAAGNVYFDGTSAPGSSGSCVLNENNEVVGLMMARIPIGTPIWNEGNRSYNQEMAAVAVGVWGNWFPPVADVQANVFPPTPAATKPEEPKP